VSAHVPSCRYRRGRRAFHTVSTIWGTACDFDGNDFVRIPNHADFAPSGDFTITLWVRPDALGGVLFGKVLEAGPANSWQLAQSSTAEWSFESSPGGGAPNGPLRGPMITLGTWVHLAAVYRAGRKLLYVDAVQHAAGTATIAYDNGEVLLGADWGMAEGNELFFDDRITDIRFYDRALSETEIRMVAGL
jgi:hypothetical protein